MFALSLTSISSLSPTFDEQGFITRGLGYLRGENRHMRVGHPLGLNALNAALLAGDASVHLPTADPSWQETSFHRPSELFLWGIGNNVAHVMFLARLPTIWLGLLLAALVGRWAWRIAGSRWAGLLALTLVALDPNILAHTQLATTDLGLAAGATVAGFTLWHYWTRPSWATAILAGVGFGLLQNTKFTAALFVPLFALVVVIGNMMQWRHSQRHGRPFPWRPLVMFTALFPLAAVITLWAAYGFQIGTLPPDLPTFPQLAGLTIPLSHHVEQLSDIGGRLQVETPSFLIGHTSRTGWWYYFPVAFLLKTPLPILLLLIMAFSLRIRYTITGKPGSKNGRRYALPHTPLPPLTARWPVFDDAALLIPALGYFMIALTSEINLGYRHLLPLLPFTAVFIANTTASHRQTWGPADAGNGVVDKQHYTYPLRPYALIIVYRLPLTFYATLAWLTLIALWIYPHFLSTFNVLAGGPDNGWRYLVDSNLDWGQDLAGLKVWMDENNIARVWLSYFGEARPEYYGIAYQGLDSWPPRLMNPAARPYYPHDPAPGLYAISATNLQGVHFTNHDQFAYFRHRDPLTKIGYSIFIYDVPAYGEPVDVVLAGLQLDDIKPQDFARWVSNQVQPRWVDPAMAMVLPSSDHSWLVLARDTAVAPTLAARLSSWPLSAQTNTYFIYQLPPPEPSTLPAAVFNLGEGHIQLLDVHLPEVAATAGQSFVISTIWQQQALPQPVKIFIHLVNDQEQIVAQWDGLGVAWEGWHEGDRLDHVHTLPMPEDVIPGHYELRVGLYHPETAVRWLTASGADYLTAGTVKVED